MKKWVCIKVSHHNEVAKTIEECEKKGWTLHTYNCIHSPIGEVVNHYLLFNKVES